MNNNIEFIFRDTMNEHTNRLREQGYRIWSISRLNNFNTCRRQYYLTYISKKPQKPSCYSILGSSAHETLELLYKGETEKLDKSIFDNEFSKCELFGINFPVSKGDIKGNYKKDMDTFYKYYKKMDGEFISELGFILKISDKDYMVGYIDLMQIIDNNTVSIFDFKTSAMFKDKKLIDAGRQLCLYQLAIEQLYDLDVSVNGWIMLKYSDVQIGNNKPMVGVQNKDLVKKCKTQIRKLMLKKDTDETLIDLYYSKCEADNSFDSLPKEIQDEIHIKTHFKPYEITKEVKEETLKYITNTISEIDKINEKNIDEWFKEGESFFCENLCSFHPKHCDGCKK